MNKTDLFPPLVKKADQFLDVKISDDRKKILEPLIEYIQSHKHQGKPIHLNFICTHNSRRSQLSQVWAQVAAAYFGIEVFCYSGGVEVTSFNERAVESLKRTGFKVENKGKENPRYQVFYSDNAQPIVAFSKTFDDKYNAVSEFAAVITCSNADENCPYIPGATARISVRYEDPKAFDGTSEEAIKYDERSHQIAAEMFYLFSKII
ncbi:protein-tyrosine-phosphatase [Echinicola jeungdonensis]|uniref:Protein-tyrosine-phosphatase n=1 Tax=Echinicola jeungdonensis TaxID=709343 RepID=A0ABV5JB55_9BACT|nr:protein-tyrosine-phosphatase [Echinicola jeungdonensis]MDN3670547.1 protein-tyrosine-phosphatase [Echinicola jeungdonensis]